MEYRWSRLDDLNHSNDMAKTFWLWRLLKKDFQTIGKAIFYIDLKWLTLTILPVTVHDRRRLFLRKTGGQCHQPGAAVVASLKL